MDAGGHDFSRGILKSQRNCLLHRAQAALHKRRGPLHEARLEVIQLGKQQSTSTHFFGISSPIDENFPLKHEFFGALDGAISVVKLGIEFLRNSIVQLTHVGHNGQSKEVSGIESIAQIQIAPCQQLESGIFQRVSHHGDEVLLLIFIVTIATIDWFLLLLLLLFVVFHLHVFQSSNFFVGHGVKDTVEFAQQVRFFKQVLGKIGGVGGDFPITQRHDSTHGTTIGFIVAWLG
mmetsp:Transcript_19531/g.46340  ORF Transcript_19531/g.46340 Transcript_19531/m.46340 type:complete len:233 (-) Transcript_19531:75-773(-)